MERGAASRANKVCSIVLFTWILGVNNLESHSTKALLGNTESQKPTLHFLFMDEWGRK